MSGKRQAREWELGNGPKTGEKHQERVLQRVPTLSVDVP